MEAEGSWQGMVPELSVGLIVVYGVVNTKNQKHLKTSYNASPYHHTHSHKVIGFILIIKLPLNSTMPCPP